MGLLKQVLNCEKQFSLFIISIRISEGFKKKILIRIVGGGVN
jgi:hypothetical protein